MWNEFGSWKRIKEKREGRKTEIEGEGERERNCESNMEHKRIKAVQQNVNKSSHTQTFCRENV